MPEVLGRYSNQAPVGVSVRALAEASAAGVRDQQWAPPKFVGTTRVGRVLATELDAMIAHYEGGMGCVLLAQNVAGGGV
jgi:hypothetical protein